jgi:hypothetical protein
MIWRCWWEEVGRARFIDKATALSYIGPHASLRIIESSAPRAAVLVRLLIGWVFLSEGIQKFLFPETLGVGRFKKIGIPRRNSLRHSLEWSRSFAADC